MVVIYWNKSLIRINFPRQQLYDSDTIQPMWKKKIFLVGVKIVSVQC